MCSTSAEGRKHTVIGTKHYMHFSFSFFQEGSRNTDGGHLILSSVKEGFLKKSMGLRLERDFC